MIEMLTHWMSPRQFLGFVHRTAYATLVSLLVWIGATIPIGPTNSTHPGVLAVMVADLPIAVATQVLPCKEFAIDLWFSVHYPEGCPPPQIDDVGELLLNHLRVGIPAYVFVLYIPNMLLGAVRWWRRRSGTASLQ